MSLARNIRKFRLERNMTQEQLASILGVSAQAVSKWETSETYPDGGLLVSIAGALDVSLDVLFDNKAYSMKDISSRIRNLILSTPKENRFHLVRDICWQMEKGLFNCEMTIDEEYDSQEIINNHLSSYILDDYGFTQVSNGRAPFFAVFAETENGFSEVIGDGEEIRKIFELLASPETMRAVLFIYKKEPVFVFEAEVLAEECKIGTDKIDKVMKNLELLHLVYKQEIKINEKKCTLYSSKPSHKMIALLIFAHELNYCGGYCYQSDYRNKPYL